MILAIALCLAAGACRPSSAGSSIEPVYDKKTGKLQLLKYDANGNGKVDTCSYMDGTRIVRIEIDSDEDGKIDRWEYYTADQKLEKVGFSRASDGREDAWSYAGPDGSTLRVEISNRRNGKVTRTEYYEKNVLVRAQEDSDEDGKIDKWETYESGRLASVAFDTLDRGTPDRRLVYGADGSTRVEIDATGSGQFVAVRQPAAPQQSRTLR